MNILLINHYAGSPRHGMEYRPFYLAREWVRAGHRVQIVAASYSHVRQHQPVMAGSDGNASARTIDAAPYGLDETIDGVSYRWLPTPAYIGNGVGRVRNIWAFFSRLWGQSAALVQAFRPDVVIASSTYPMDIWVARRIARLAGARLVYEVHDLWPASPIELGGMSPWHPFILLCRKAENDAYRDADVVVSMLPKVAAHMAAHGLDLRKLHIVPNGVAAEEWIAPAADPAMAGAALEGQATTSEATADSAPELETDLVAHLAAQKRAGRTIVGYAGSHGRPNVLDVLLDAAELLHDEPFAFVLVGDGHEKQRLAERVRAEGLANVVLFPPIPKALVPAFLGQIDIAYIGWQRVPIYRFGIAPNKLMDYMMAGCVVLHSVEAGNDPVAEAGCGLTVEPESAAAVATGLKALAASPADERLRMGKRGRAFVMANHTYKVLAARFIDAVVKPAVA